MPRHYHRGSTAALFQGTEDAVLELHVRFIKPLMHLCSRILRVWSNLEDVEVCEPILNVICPAERDKVRSIRQAAVEPLQVLADIEDLQRCEAWNTIALLARPSRDGGGAAVSRTREVNEFYGLGFIERCRVQDRPFQRTSLIPRLALEVATIRAMPRILT
eukprot:CAMPEP_0170197028 /NCGR_PEP_ID=MMETSP0040_2-20121228/65391_1 /TAXON_ID=641309 /ORGANISM="Lotharella oceanica, Strain CCMP622" /LENGTH=160 /DNA_ID=CAMNT_0010446621 /DNA_START=761 /DNA_END=1243 /DNA_ORIENTATION=+